MIIKNFLRNIGVIAYFLLAQAVGSVIIFLYKYKTDFEWAHRITDCILEDNILSSEYVKTMSEVLMPCLILADIIIMLPIIINIIKSNKRVIKKISAREIIILVGIGILVNIVVSEIINIIPYSNNNELYRFVEQLTISDNLLSNILIVGIASPVMEELLFRYVLIEINKNKPKYAIIVSSLAFGMMHMNLVQSTYAFLIGIAFGYIYVKTNNLLNTIILHVTINSSSVIYGYLPNQTLQIAAISIGMAIGLAGVAIYILSNTKYIVKVNRFIKAKCAILREG